MLPFLLALLPADALAKPIPESSPDHAYHYQAAPLMVGDVKLTPSSVWARAGEMKFKLQVDNPTDRFVVFPKNGLSFTNLSGSFTPAKGDGRFEVVYPFGNGAHTFVIVDGAGGLHQRDAVAQLTGLSTASRTGERIPAEATTLPATSNTFSAGPFACEGKGKVIKKTDVLEASWTCRYEGAVGSVGLVDESALAVVIEAGRFANEAKGRVSVLFPGDTVGIKLKNTTIQPGPHKVDLQYATLPIHWEGVFAVSQLEAAQIETFVLVIDEGLTKAKNE